MAGLLRREPTA